MCTTGKAQPRQTQRGSVCAARLTLARGAPCLSLLLVLLALFLICFGKSLLGVPQDSRQSVQAPQALLGRPLAASLLIGLSSQAEWFWSAVAGLAQDKLAQWLLFLVHNSSSWHGRSTPSNSSSWAQQGWECWRPSKARESTLHPCTRAKPPLWLPPPLPMGQGEKP